MYKINPDCLNPVKPLGLLALAIAGLLMLGAAETVNAQELLDRQAPLPSHPQESEHWQIQPRSLELVPAGDFGNQIRRGYQLFVNTQQLRGKYVGNSLNCVNCHLDAGRQADAAPLWAAYFSYPAYRRKNDKVNSFAERLQGCFVYSTNGKAPAKNSPEIIALSAYAYWLGMGGLMNHYQISGTVPELTAQELIQGGLRDDFPLPAKLQATFPTKQRDKLDGRGYPKLKPPTLKYSIRRGHTVYKQHCQFCHGANGQGSAAADIFSLPPLWGENSYNWGAGMHNISTAASFIYQNMPLGKSIQLNEQQAWDVAAYINSHERPQDPRFSGNVEKLKQKYHHHDCFYGQAIDHGEILGRNAFPDFSELLLRKP